MKTIDDATFGARLIKKRKMSAKKYLKESSEGTVTKARFVPPKIGAAGFGHFEVELVSPRYEVVLD